eukprot:6200145-Pleurochrysis_carterae.AAC.5
MLAHQREEVSEREYAHMYVRRHGKNGQRAQRKATNQLRSRSVHKMEKMIEWTPRTLSEKSERIGVDRIAHLEALELQHARAKLRQFYVEIVLLGRGDAGENEADATQRRRTSGGASG